MTTVVAIVLMAIGLALLVRAHHAEPESKRNPAPPDSWTGLVVLLVALSGCGRPVAHTVVDFAGRTTDAAVPVLVGQMKREGLQAIESSLTREEALVRVSDIRRKWAPVWGVLDVLRRLHDAAAGIIESGGELTLQHVAELRAAYCDARKVLEGSKASLPQLPLLPCVEAE